MSGAGCTLYALFADALYAFESGEFGGETGFVATNITINRKHRGEHLTKHYL